MTYMLRYTMPDREPVEVTFRDMDAIEEFLRDHVGITHKAKIEIFLQLNAGELLAKVR
jgi:hypothetical protein